MRFKKKHKSNFLMHHGTPQEYDYDPHGSGRYRQGSGANPGQHEKNFSAYVRDLRKKNNWSETQTAEYLGMSTTQLRQQISISKAQTRAENASKALAMHDRGMGPSAIGRELGLPESTVRNLLDPTLRERNDKTREIADVIKRNVDSKDYLDVGIGTELSLGVSETRMKNAIAMLEDEGYKVNKLKIEQMGNPGHYTIVKVLTKEDVPYKQLYDNMDKVKLIDDDKDASGNKIGSLGLVAPKSLSSDRLMVRYDEDGGTQKDGVIEIRKGVEDLSLGKSRYAQVRIAVDGTHYLKGMAMYADDKDFPPGVDVIFNSNKHRGTPVLNEDPDGKSVLKPMKTDKDGNINEKNPFGATIKPVHIDPDTGLLTGGQREYYDEKGNKQLSCVNIVNEEGNWGEWSKTLASQMLSKQQVPLAKRQLNLTYAQKEAEFQDLKELTNPEVKKKLLLSFAEDCDASAVHLKAAALPRQASHVILPFPDLKDDSDGTPGEIYAPKYKEGEHVVLIRYPHGGTFEIPELVVKNKGTKADKLIHNAADAVGINPKVAEKLSGADFDGDTVLVIPVNERVKIKTKPSLKDLKDFNPKELYPAYEGMKVISNSQKQKEMGKVTNLITDMTLKGATDDELARAVKHSMVVIDAEKHKLNWKLSEKENGIDELKRKYQRHTDDDGYGGATTIISRAKSEERVNQRKMWNPSQIDPETGKKWYKETGATYEKTKKLKDGTVVKTGKTVTRQDKSTKMAETDDAYTLVSAERKPMELAYADYANKMKALGNAARKEYISTGNLKLNPSAKKTYAKEVASLNAKLNEAEKNAPRERRAQLCANVEYKYLVNNNPNADSDTRRKWKGQALAGARAKVGAGKERIKIEDREWDAIQAGALSSSKVKRILDNTDSDALKKRATPRFEKGISPTKKALIRSMEARNYTLAEIAEAVGVSTSTVQKALA